MRFSQSVWKLRLHWQCVVVDVPTEKVFNIKKEIVANFSLFIEAWDRHIEVSISDDFEVI